MRMIRRRFRFHFVREEVALPEELVEVFPVVISAQEIPQGLAVIDRLLQPLGGMSRDGDRFPTCPTCPNQRQKMSSGSVGKPVTNDVRSWERSQDEGHRADQSVQTEPEPMTTLALREISGPDSSNLLFAERGCMMNFDLPSRTEPNKQGFVRERRALQPLPNLSDVASEPMLRMGPSRPHSTGFPLEPTA